MKYKLSFLYDYVLPNMILPNALITEFAIVNYIHTMHSTKMNFFDTNDNPSWGSGAASFNNRSMMDLIFQEKLGLFPNSLITKVDDSNIHAHCYRRSLDILEESIYFGKKQGITKYVYPIRITPHFDFFAGSELRVPRKLNGEYFWKYMSAESLMDVQQRNAVIFLDYGQENYIERESYIKIHNALEHSSLPASQIILALNSFNSKEIYESWFPPDERRITVQNWPFVMCNTSYHYAATVDNDKTIADFNNSRSYYRKHHFLFKIRRPRAFRMALLYRMASDGLLEKADWSCLTSVTCNSSRINHLADKYKFVPNMAAIEAVHSAIPHTLDSEPDIAANQVSAWTDKHSEPYKDSYFYVCTEMFTHGEYKSLTEKIFKPMANLQPFLFLANCNVLKTMRELGFKTFSPMIDESYDDEPDEVTRLNMIYSEIHRLSSMSKEDLHIWYWSMEDILRHNHEHLLKIHIDEPHSLALFKCLLDKTS